MTHLARLSETLNATAVIGNAAICEGPAQAMAQAINRTTLPRRLDVDLPDSGRLRLFARDRRLHRMERDGAQTAPWNAELDPSDSDAVAASLSRVCPAGSIVKIKARISDTDTAFEGIGIAAGTLIERLAEPTGPASDFDMQAHILDAVRRDPAQVEASFVMADGAIAALSGDDHTIETLSDEVTEIMAQVADEGFPLAGALETDGTLILPRSHSATGCHLLVGRLGMIGLLVLNDASPGAALKLWPEQAA